jgi:hypothetical protein
MALYWLTYKRYGRLVRVAIVSAESMTMARSRAEFAGIHTGTMFAGGHVLEPEFAARVPPIASAEGWRAVRRLSCLIVLRGTPVTCGEARGGPASTGL